MKIFIRMSFLGNKFYGTQKLSTFNTVQGCLEDALSNLYNEKIKVTICSRLDRNVSAFDYVVTYQASKVVLKLEKILFYLSNYIPDIHFKEIKYVSDDFSARYSCKGKIYSYLIQNGVFNPLFKDTSLYLRNKLDVLKLEEGLKLFEGEHDFKNFASFDEEENSILTINHTDITINNGLTILSLSSKSFLKYEVRFIIGTVLQYAEDKISKEDIIKLLDGKDIKFLRKKVDSKGLFLYKIIYPEFDDESLSFNSINVFDDVI